VFQSQLARHLRRRQSQPPSETARTLASSHEVSEARAEFSGFRPDSDEIRRSVPAKMSGIRHDDRAERCPKCMKGDAAETELISVFFQAAKVVVGDERSEFAFINWVRARTAPHPVVALGIGDDAALIRLGPRGECLVTADMLMEGIDFRLPEADPRAVGHKALAVNLSDMAAMAGRPLAAVVSVALPKRQGRELAEGIYAGIESLAAKFDVAIAGGDTNSWDGPLVLNVTLLGQPTGSGPVRRSGAQVGDWIVVTGSFGGSIAGKHLTFEPRVNEALVLHKTVELHSMIDVSDGLAADLYHILDESQAGARVWAERIPASEAARQAAGSKSALEHALGDGEDFELLFTVSADDGRRLLAAPPFETPLTHIGEITAGRVCQLVHADGRSLPLERLGWVHEV
jgi:thiamine-monophosphate kinase